MPWIIGGAALLGSGLDAFSSRGANKTNIKNQREQRDWDKEMSNTAVQRRADDIQRAGGNRALAFTGGQSASTPSISAPTVEPIFKGVGRDFASSAGQAMLMRAQLDNLQAQTTKTSAETRQTNTITNAMEGTDETVEGRTRATELKTKVVTFEQAKQQLNNLQIAGQASASQLQLLNQTLQSHIDIANQKARTGRLELDALENVAKAFALEANKVGATAGGFAKMFKFFIDLYRSK